MHRDDDSISDPRYTLVQAIRHLRYVMERFGVTTRAISRTDFLSRSCMARVEAEHGGTRAKSSARLRAVGLLTGFVRTSNLLPTIRHYGYQSTHNESCGY